MGENTVAWVLCGALAREVIDIAKRHAWDVAFFGISAQDHTLPQRIAPHVEHKLRELIPLYKRVAVLYGDCGTGGTLDEVLGRYNVPRISGPHCYEMYGGQVHDQLMQAQPGSFFLTDFLVRGFEGTIWKTLGLDRYPELRDTYFGNYTHVVYLQQNDQPDLLERAKHIAQRLGLTFEVRKTGYGELERRLVALMDEIFLDKYAPISPDKIEQIHGKLPNSILARHTGAGAGARRSRARQRSAVTTVSRGS
jgi:hypothetical protein